MYKKVTFYIFIVIFAVCTECFYVGNHEPDVAPNESLMRRFFRWLGFVAPPVLGFSHYNNVDFGEPGELQNGIGIRFENFLVKLFLPIV
jgi:hypothetical protein